MRYSVFPVSGFPIESRTKHFFRLGADPKKPLTTWYIADNANCGYVVAAFRSKHKAHYEAFRMNAFDRDHDKWAQRIERAR